MTEPVSPLSEASPTSLDDYFSQKPPFAPEALRAMIAEFRRMRVKWESDSQEAKNKPKKAAKSAPASAIPLNENDLWASEPDGGPK